ncbi:isopeptide-forming domain-containing fimbrial protein [Holdemanella sp.]|uniref:isopeptide-forming domain-containing fimbrial protein n=1 Tax=Holdemanella sp. TaxID=1971762 RepID=UPI002E79E015|nr:SpaA isopeptide-forming pilin-related protein [Holdemanella sp.]MEE0467169.1 isopeptide-forming domain-containing fimbrial protein [Holdemanella sp.]
MKTKNVVFAGLTALSMTLSPVATCVAQLVTPVYAAEATQTYATPNGVADFGKGNASITITPNAGQSLVGKKFQVYKLFDAENAVDNESINYTWNNDYKTALQTVVGKKINKSASSVTEYDVIDYIQTLNTNKVEGAQADQKLEGRYSNYRHFVEALRDELVKEGLSPNTVNVTAVNAVDGSVKFSGLGYGYYLTDEVTAVQDTHSAASLILTNTANPNAQVNIKSDYPTLIKKINEDDNNVGWNDIGDYEIGQTVPYYHDTYVPDMNGYQTYKMIFHDKMDNALTFNKDSVSITISSNKKSYTLKSNEFKVVENSGEDTFYAEIPDLKAIVDKQFPEGMNNNENTYGQSVRLNYNATLNDNASTRTGRAGFENAVRLEYSNNPDSDGNGSTGTTPWDTVVCFTYKINGLKVNNHNKLLKNAKFRLYSDENCTNEVYVKESPNGYVVMNRDSLGGTDHTGGARPSSAVEMASDAKGVFTILGLDQGTYYLKETDSPAGYRELQDPIVITIKPTFTDERNNYNAGEGATDKTLKTLEATAHVKEFLNGAYKESDTDLKTDVTDGSANITVVNYVGTKLPITGSNLTMICLGAGTITVVGALALDKKRKNKKD